MIIIRLFSRTAFSLSHSMALPVVTVLGIATLAAIIFLPDSFTTRYFHDDAFFVLKTANNIGSGHGSTFDGINLTNGYHPLNLWLLSLFSILMPIEGGSGIDAVIVVNMAMTAVGLVLIDHFTKQAGFTRFARLFVLIGITGLLAFNDFGLESRLLLPIAWLLMLTTLRTIRSGNSNTLAFGFVGVAVVLTRLDASIFVIFIAIFASLWRTQPLIWTSLRAAFNRFTLLILPSAVAVLGYMIYNWVVFSEPMTVSSWLKFGWPIVWDSNRLFQPGMFMRVGLCLSASLAFMLAVYFVPFNFKRRLGHGNQGGIQWLLGAANAYSVIYVLIVIVFLRGEFGSWYLALPLSISIITFGYLMVIFFEVLEGTQMGISALRTSAKVLLMSAVIAVAIIFSMSKIARGERDNAIAMGMWMRDNLPADARIYQVDQSEYTAYFSERSVINGDGLINSWEYQDALRNDGLIDYLKKYGVGFMINTHSTSNIRVRLWNEPSQILTFKEEPEKMVIFGKFVLLKVDLSSAVVIQQENDSR